MTLFSLSAITLEARVHRLEGLVGLGYEDYDMKSDSGRSASATSFYQKYKLSTGLSGNAYNERSGPYKLLFNYHHDAYQNKINGGRYSLKSSNLDWNGVFALSLNHLNGFYIKFYSENDEFSRYRYADLGGGRLGVGYQTYVEEAVYRRHGFGGQMGLNGGPYYYYSFERGEFEDHDGNVSRFDSGNFSVNSGSNWLTLAKSASNEGGWDEFVLRVGNVGTRYGRGKRGNVIIDQREWYRVSNWLKISTDYRYSKKNAPSADSETNRLTLALNGKRERWVAYTFSTYGRFDDGAQSRYDLSLPFWLDTYSSPRSTLRLKSSYSESGYRNTVAATEGKSKSVNESISWWMKANDNFSLESNYSFSQSASDLKDSVSHSFNIKGYTHGSEQMNYNLGYSLSLLQNDDKVYGDTSSYSHSLNGNLTYVFEPGKAMTIGQSFGLFYNEAGEPHNKSKTSNTDLTYRTNVGEKSSFSTGISKHILKFDDGSSSIQDKLNIHFRSKMSNKASFNSFVDYERAESDMSQYTKSELDKYRSEMSLTYKESRELTSTTTLFNNRNLSSAYDSDTQGVSESLEHNIFRKGYGRRTLFNTKLGLSYYQEKSGLGKTKYGSYGISINYYPLRRVSLGAGIAERDDLEGSFNELNSTFYFGISYPLLSINGNYMHSEYHNGYDEDEDKYKIDIVKRF